MLLSWLRVFFGRTTHFVSKQCTIPSSRTDLFSWSEVCCHTWDPCLLLCLSLTLKAVYPGLVTRNDLTQTSRIKSVIDLVRCFRKKCPYLLSCPHGLTFTWWGCCGLWLWHTPSEFAHSCLFCYCVCFCLYGPFNCISFHKFSRELSALSVCSSDLNSNWSFHLYISLWKSPSALI